MKDSMNIDVVHRDEHLLVVCKPSGLPTTSPTGTGCLVEEVRRLDPDAPRLHPSSRLDAEVTGLVVFARDRLATHALLDARERGVYKRRYIALMAGAPQPLEGEWDWSIDIDPKDARGRVALAADSKRGRHALTRYRVRPPRGDNAPLVVADLWPQTGRTHQLRVHAARAGAPMLGDRHYGGLMRLSAADGRVTRAGRVMLHCAEVSVPDPGGGGPLSFVSPAPEDMQRLNSTFIPEAGAL